MEQKELEQKLASTITALELYMAKGKEEQESTGRIATDTKGKIGELQTQLDAIDKRLVESHKNTPVQTKSIKEVMGENEDLNRIVRDKKGRAIFTLGGDQAQELMGQKTTILSGGTGFSQAVGGVVGAERIPIIVPEARRRLRVRELLTARPTASPLIYYVKVSTPMTNGVPQVEGALKAENAVQFATVTTNVQTIASFIPASKQILDDFDELLGFLKSSLPYYVNRAEDAQILTGDGTGNNLNGLVTQATAFNAGLLSAAAGWTRIDQILAAAAQVDIADEIPAEFVVLNPRDMFNLERTKDGFGRYLFTDIQTRSVPKIWGLTTVSTNAIPFGTFLVGNGDPAAVEIRDRMEMQFDISTEDVDNFRKNMVTVRAEKRVALVVMRPQSFVSGTFATSPAGL